MIVCISGSRDDYSFAELIRTLLLDRKPELVLVGCAKGVDATVRDLCQELNVPIKVFKADWSRGPVGGYNRNRAMLDAKPDEVWTFHRDIESSKGTKMTAELAEKDGIQVVYFDYSDKKPEGQKKPGTIRLPESIPKVVNVRVMNLRMSKPAYSSLKEWMQDPDNEYVGRGHILDNYTFPEKDSIWANPFKAPRDGDLPKVLDLYEKHIRDFLSKDEKNRSALLELGKKQRIGCWCVDHVFAAKNFKAPVCHAQILQKLIFELVNNKKE